MPLRWLALLSLFFSASTRAYEFPIEIFEYVDNARVVAFINERDIAESSQWNPYQGSPPIAISAALSSIKKYIAAEKDLTNAQLEEIGLRKIPQHENQWHYMVKLKTQIGRRPHYHYLVMLMSGKIIPAIREPDSIK